MRLLAKVLKKKELKSKCKCKLHPTLRSIKTYTHLRDPEGKPLGIYPLNSESVTADMLKMGFKIDQILEAPNQKRPIPQRWFLVKK